MIQSYDQKDREDDSSNEHILFNTNLVWRPEANIRASPEFIRKTRRNKGDH